MYFALLQILDRWQFWLGIGLAAAFFIVLVYFVVRGFKTYKKLKEERTQQQQLEQEQEKQKTLQHDIENPLPSPTMESTPKCQRPINVDELARRTGRRRKDLITTHAGHHHHRRSNSLASEATSVSSITLESAAETVKTAL